MIYVVTKSFYIKSINKILQIRLNQLPYLLFFFNEFNIYFVYFILLLICVSFS